MALNLGIVFGPKFSTDKHSTIDLFAGIMTGKMPGVPRVKFGFVDARDAAQAHLQSVLVEEAANQKFIIVGHVKWFREIGQTLLRDFGNGYPSTQSEMPKCLIIIGSWFDGNLAVFRNIWGKEYTLDSARSERVLKFKYTDFTDTVIDTANKLIETGYVPDLRQKK